MANTMHFPRRARRITSARICLAFAVFLAGGVLAAPAVACPVCDTGTGKAVRAGVFNDDFGKHFLATALPFPVFAGIVAFLYYGPPALPLRRRSSFSEVVTPDHFIDVKGSA